MSSKTGVIYILTSQSFPDYVKMGYTKDIEHLLGQLNASGCLPYLFKVYAVYETDEQIADKKLHNLLISMNPTLQSFSGIGANKLTKEFYAVSAENAYAILDAIAEISGTKGRLKRMDSTEYASTILDALEGISREKDQLNRENALNYKRENQMSSDIFSKSHKTQKSPFSFTKCGIPIGSKVEFVNDPSKTATVVSDREVKYLGKIGSLTRFTMEILHDDTPIRGPKYWTYMGKRLTDIRSEREEKGQYK